MLLLLPFGAVGLFMTFNQCLAIVMIGISVSLLLAVFICKKYFNIRLNPRRDVEEKHPTYVAWVQARVDEEKENREFRKSLWNK